MRLDELLRRAPAVVKTITVDPSKTLLFWTHFVRPSYSGLDWLALIVAGLLGPLERLVLAGKRKWALVLAYDLLLVRALSLAGLLAVYSPGDCL